MAVSISMKQEDRKSSYKVRAVCKWKKASMEKIEKGILKTFSKGSFRKLKNKGNDCVLPVLSTGLSLQLSMAVTH